MNLKILSIFIILYFVLSCNSNIDFENNSNNHKINDSITLHLRIFEPDISLYSLLDSIVEAVNHCPNPKPGKLEFVFMVYIDHCKINISVFTINNFLYDYSLCNAMFTYNGYRFYYQGSFLSCFFIDKNKVIIQKSLNPDILVFDIDDREYHWRYVIENAAIKGILVSTCKKLWFDPSYFISE